MRGERFYIYRQVDYSDHLYSLFNVAGFSDLESARTWLFNLPAEKRNGQMFLIKGMRFSSPAELVLSPGYKASRHEKLEVF